MPFYKLTNDERKRLLDAAISAAINAHAPYSNFRVGCAVLASEIHIGCNVENSSYGLGLCAERNALSTAIAKGDVNIRGIAIACIDGDPKKGLNELMPCGACRQWIQELAPDAEILVAGSGSIFNINDLLPNPFKLNN